ncbi:TPA: hypothetical protein ACF754_001943 [Legionella pneumophila]|nr:hypothetical protein [Legionella pneumophila]HAT9524276.1 hypothetical protein [Legionella pneumophila subsp. pneumophila]HAU0865650.1 hypothetical protein [Legionella pneumophila]HDV5726026.1 hypothetical protein [Legionella pneumophila]HDV5727771.1 hypothetical protein [Legionella pneumophila]
MLQDFLKDKVTLVKNNGTKVRSEIPAQVSSNRIIIFDSSLPIEVGDHILRELKSGLVEDFIVDNPCIQTGHGSIPDSFQIKVHRSDEPTAKPEIIINQISGNNARINIRSTDNSTNIVGDHNQLFSTMNQLIEDNIDSDDERERLKVLVSELKENVGKPNFKNAYDKFIEGAANHMTIFVPIISALSSLL